MNKYASLYLNKLSGYRISLDGRGPSLLAELLEKVRMNSLPSRLQIVAPTTAIGAAGSGLIQGLIEANKSDERRLEDKAKGKTPEGNILNAILSGAGSGLVGGAMYTAGRDGTLINPIR